MSVAGEHLGVSHQEEDKLTRDIIGAGSAIAAFVGFLGVVLCVFGLVGINAPTMAAVSTILIGGALLIEGGSIAARSRKLGAEVGTQEANLGIGGEMAVESLVGMAGIVMGVLALLDIYPLTLMAAAGIIMGSGLLVESSLEAQLSRVHLISYQQRRSAEQITQQVVEASAGADILFGLSGIVLGILALVGFVPLTLILVTMLTLGVGILFGGSALAGRFLGAFK